VDGAAEVRFLGADDGTTRLECLYQRAPLKLLLPADRETGVMAAVVLNTAGGLVGGDRLTIGVEAGAGTAVLVTGQAAEKAYRSAGPQVTMSARLAVGPGAWLEWLPQGTIVFDGARLRRITTLDLAAGARVMAGEIMVFGRRARGERFTRGSIHDGWRVHRDGRMVWADALRLDGDVAAAFASPACLDRAAAIATVVVAAEDSVDALAFVRATGDGRLGNDDGRKFAATRLGPLVVARMLDRDAARLRVAFGQIWAMLRHRLAGLPPRLPRVWSI
jgi:urease accessory protein